MTAPIKILGLGGSFRANSTSLTVVKLGLAAAEATGATTDLIDVGKLRLPFFQPNQPIEDYPDADYIREYLAKFQAAQGFLWCAPTYHGTPSAVYKNALDFLDLLPRRPNLYLTGKVAGLMVVSSGIRFAASSLNSLTVNAHALRLLVAPTGFPIAPVRAIFDQQGQLTDEKIAAAISELAGDVVRLTQQIQPKIEN